MSSQQQSSHGRSGAIGAAAVEVLLIVLVFAAQAAWLPPDPNEAHYLGKARHFWDPQWAAGDFFLESADSHAVFYAAFGWPSLWLSFETLAWGGRLLTWIWLAWTWRLLSRAVAPRRLWAVCSAAVFLVLSVCCHMAGEWVVGGFEAKGIAYGFVFWALSLLIQGRWNGAWLCLGAAALMHVLVGGWSMVALGIAWLADPDRPKLTSMLPAMIGGLALATPALWAALTLNSGVDAAIVAEAHRVYVFERLRHHLSPRGFPPWFVARHAMMLLVWLALAARTMGQGGPARLHLFVAGAVGISAVGMTLGLVSSNQPETLAGWLRLYWFRLCDAALPIGVAVSIISLAKTYRRPSTVLATALAAGAVLVALNVQEFAFLRGADSPPRADRPGRVLDHGDWRDACEWAGANTPANARFLTPRLAQTFKWYAERPEVISWKDIPQDAVSIVEWWRRLREIHGFVDIDGDEDWHLSLTELSVGELQQISRRYACEYVITEAEPRLSLERLYANASYAIYRLRR